MTSNDHETHLKNSNVSIVKEIKQLLNPWIIPIATVIGVSIYPVLFLYFNNADSASFVETLSTLITVVGISIALFLLLAFFMHSTIKGGLCGSIFMILVLNYKLVESVVRILSPFLYYWHVAPICLLIASILTYIIHKKMLTSTAIMINSVTCLVIFTLIVMNGIIAAPTIIKKQIAEKQAPQIEKLSEKVDEKYMPNIYYFIFDEFSTIDFMKKYYNYDNTELEDQLSEIGFNISHSSRNESTMTENVTTDLFNLSYIVTDDMTSYEKRQLRVNNSVFHLLRENGYEIEAACAAPFYGLEDVVTGSSQHKSVTIEGKTINDLIFDNTILYPFRKEMDNSIIKQLNWIINLNTQDRHNKFLLFHINLPHPPFILDYNGNLYNKPTSDWQDKEKYLGQYVFTTKKMIEIAQKLVAEDKECIIFLTSDHSARASYSEETYFEHNDKIKCFNSVYYQGESIEIEGLSGVNTLRTVFNKLFNTTYDIIEVPIFEY